MSQKHIHLNSLTHDCDEDESVVTVQIPTPEQLSITQRPYILRLYLSPFRKYRKVILDFNHHDYTDIKVVLIGKTQYQTCIVKKYFCTYGLLHANFNELVVLNSKVDCLRLLGDMENTLIVRDSTIFHLYYHNFKELDTKIGANIVDFVAPIETNKLYIDHDLYYANGRYYDFDQNPRCFDEITNDLVQYILPHMI